MDQISKMLEKILTFTFDVRILALSSAILLGYALTVLIKRIAKKMQ